MNTIESKTGKFRFIEINKTENKKTLVFDRTDTNNEEYLVQVASLCFHKALFGISELKALEGFLKHKRAGGFRMSKAINTYYVIFHLMTLCMLLDEDYVLVFKKKLDNGKVPLEVNERLLNSSNDTPTRWNKQRDLEKDMASMIDHSEIKKYCEGLRNSGDFSELIRIVYEHFVSTKCKFLCYEKICYIRDRIIYRPTLVIDDINGDEILTSADVREEIDTLPNFKQLYDFVNQLHSKIIQLYQKSWDNNVVNIYSRLLAFLWRGFPVYEDRQHLIDLGWTEQDIEAYRSKVTGTNLAFDSYISHLIEIVDIERMSIDIEEIWLPLKKEYEVVLGNDLKRKR